MKRRSASAVETILTSIKPAAVQAWVGLDPVPNKGV